MSGETERAVTELRLCLDAVGKARHHLDNVYEALGDKDDVSSDEEMEILDDLAEITDELDAALTHITNEEYQDGLDKIEEDLAGA